MAQKDDRYDILGSKVHHYEINVLGCALDLHMLSTGTLDAPPEDGLRAYISLVHRLNNWRASGGAWKVFDECVKRVLIVALMEYKKELLARVCEALGLEPEELPKLQVRK